MSRFEIARRPEACRATGRGTSALYQDVRDGLLTPPVKLGARASGWPRHELDAVVAARIAGKSSEEIRTLVQRLIADREVSA